MVQRPDRERSMTSGTARHRVTAPALPRRLGQPLVGWQPTVAVARNRELQLPPLLKSLYRDHSQGFARCYELLDRQYSEVLRSPCV
jgi:hypothetical protein